MREANAQRAVRDDLGQREVGRLDVKVALDYLQVRRDAAEELVCFAVGNVAEAQDLPYLARREELLELFVCELRVGRLGSEVRWSAAVYLCGNVLVL